MERENEALDNALALCGQVVPLESLGEYLENHGILKSAWIMSLLVSAVITMFRIRPMCI